MVGGDKLLEDYVLITILAEGDITKYVVPTVSLVIAFLLHSSSILMQSYSTIFKALMISEYEFMFLCIRW